ncbi:MAG TPA: alanine--glyoxylate aminotransferase family protein [Acidobacteriota bacterium]|nr:alanine--glyoxylate aminotransferase family protein [Acidobacteriota bacterium]
MPEWTPFRPPRRLLLGPGPATVDPRVLQAMAAPLLGYLDPFFQQCMDEIQEMLRYVFDTKNRVTLMSPGTGTSGMQCTLVNLIEAGDEVLVCVNGYFSNRICDLVERCGGKAIRVEFEWGQPIDMDRVASALKSCRAVILAMVHAETSTGMRQPIERLRELLSVRDVMFLVDAVTSLGGIPVGTDHNGIDACYSCTQKAIGAPPGLSPVTFSEKALQKVRARKAICRDFYLDITLLERYWSKERVYHHTAPVSAHYAAHEALRLIAEEGLEARWKRHEQNSLMLQAGIEAMGLQMLVAPQHRLWTLNTVRVPEGVDEAKVRDRLLQEHNIEIGAGLGPLKGRIWRIGLMGAASTRDNVLLLLSALEKILKSEGLKAGSGVKAAEAYSQ